MTLAPAELPRQSSPGAKCSVTAPLAPSSCYACTCTLVASTMQPPRRLLLVLLLHLPGMWADPEGKWEPQFTPIFYPCTVGPHRGVRGWAWTGQFPRHQEVTLHPTAPKNASSLPTCAGFLAPHRPAQPSTTGTGVRVPEQPRGNGSLSQAWGAGVPPKTLSPCRDPAGSRGSQPLTHNSPALGSNPLSRS